MTLFTKLIWYTINPWLSKLFCFIAVQYLYQIIVLYISERIFL